MSVLVVGSVALDTVKTPFGVGERVLGGSAVYFGAAASLLSPVQVVGVVGEDYPVDRLAFLSERGVDLSGVETAAGESFFWAGEYSFDLNSRETLETKLGVFADFKPRIPAAFRDARIVFLGNIDPVLQMEVLDQVAAPSLVACDTMNYWISGSRENLLKLLARVDVLMVNDSEVRELAGEPNLMKAARWVREQGPDIVVVKKGEHGASDTMNYWISGSRDNLLKLLARVDVLMVNDSEVRELAGEPNLMKAARWVREQGPKIVVVKKGEHGAILFGPTGVFFTPGYPLEEVFDPTGAGDAFAGGFLGYLAHTGSMDPDDLRRAMVYGSVMGSYAVEAFSVDRFRTLDIQEVMDRVRDFRTMTTFELQPLARTHG